MLKALFLEVGTLGALTITLLATLSLLLWMPAVASVATSSMHWFKKLSLQLLLAVFPPSAMVVLGARIIGGQRRASSRVAEGGRLAAAGLARIGAAPRGRAADSDRKPVLSKAKFSAPIGRTPCRLCPAA